MAIEVRTRGYFLEIADILENCKFKNSDISFREACYALKSKVNRVIRERMNDVFKIDEAKKQEFDSAKFEFCKQFAKRDEKGEIVYTESNGGKSYAIADGRLDETNEALKKWSAENGWDEFVAENERIAKEKAAWLSKKVKLDLRKVSKFSEIGTIDGTTDGSEINEQALFNELAELLCEEKIESSEEDGEEVE